MGVIVRRNERSWAIDLISEIRIMVKSLGLKIKSAGGESTLSANRKSMFPDVLLYEDEAQTKILQGWELKMPDVLITDEEFIRDAERKAKVLGLNSFVIWNFTYGKLYIKNDVGEFKEAKVWDGTSHIVSREDVKLYKGEWLPVIKDIILTVNDFFMTGEIKAIPYTEHISEGIISEIIQRNKELVAERMELETGHRMSMERRLKMWWNEFREEYVLDENNMYSAYAKSVLLNWTNRFLFANTVKRFHNSARKVDWIDLEKTPEDGNVIFEQIAREGDFYNIFNKMEFNEVIPKDTWVDIVDFNQFLIENHIDQIDQSVLQDILERTVNISKREVRGQYATPGSLADILAQVTIEDWNADCADLCAGTGTIAKAIIKNKFKRISDAEKVYATTWMSDKYAYPLQIANISVTNIESLNIPIHMFQSDVFALNTGDTKKIISPKNGEELERTIPKFGAIVSNLPFVQYNRIGEDEFDYIADIQMKIMEDTGIEFTSGKTDLYNYIPFKLYDLLDENGRLGIILSNSWLGTGIGRKFFDALQFYYDIQSVAISDNQRWFRNADVVGTFLILKKRSVSQPDRSHRVSFWLIHKDIHTMEELDREILIDSMVLNVEIDDDVATCRRYSYEQIEEFTAHGITLNALFHDVLWMDRLSDKLAPVTNFVTVKRGERRGWNDLFYPKQNSGIEEEYIRPVLKNPASLKSYMAETDIEAFCCHRSKEELRDLGHEGALRWIEKFENIRNGSGKRLPRALSRAGNYWYEMNDAAKADFVTALNPDRRLFVARFNERTFVDQRFTRMLVKEEDLSIDLLHAILNSVYGMFAIEAIGFGRGLGVLDASSTRLKGMYMIDIRQISEKDATEIVNLFEKIKKRDVMDVEEELEDRDRIAFDRKVLESVGAGDLYEDIKLSLLSMQHTRHCVE